MLHQRKEGTCATGAQEGTSAPEDKLEVSVKGKETGRQKGVGHGGGRSWEAVSQGLGL